LGLIFNNLTPKMGGSLNFNIIFKNRNLEL